MSKIFCTISNEDASELTKTIIEVEACQELYQSAITNLNYEPNAFKILLEYYLFSLKVHKELWWNMLSKYLGEEDAAFYRDSLRFDIIKKVIFITDEVCQMN